MAGIMTKPKSSLKVDTFEITTILNRVDHTLNLENGSHFNLSLQSVSVATGSYRENYDFQLTVGYNNFRPNKISAKMKSTPGLHSGWVEIIPPETVKKLGLTLTHTCLAQYNWIIEVAYPQPDEDQPIKNPPFTIAMDYEAKAETLQDLSDFSIICKERTFPCHKVVLAARSDSLAGLIKDMKNEKVVIKEFAPVVVENMITFMYTDNLPKNPSIEDTEELFKIADKYQVDSLRQTCELILLKDLEISNALRRLHFAKKYEAEKLLEKSLKIVKENIVKFVFSKEYALLMADFPDIWADKNT